MRVVVCGSRTWTNWAVIESELKDLPPGSTVIHGGARGADTMAAAIALELPTRLNIVEYPVDWTKAKQEFGARWRMAGPLRNKLMLDVGKPDRVIAFRKRSGKSSGTDDLIGRAYGLGIPTKIIYG